MMNAAEPVMVDLNDPREKIIVNTNGYDANNYNGFTVEFDQSKQKQHERERQRWIYDQQNQKAQQSLLSRAGSQQLNVPRLGSVPSIDQATNASTRFANLNRLADGHMDFV